MCSIEERHRTDVRSLFLNPMQEIGDSRCGIQARCQGNDVAAPPDTEVIPLVELRIYLE